jgi:hypothetical protein
MPAAGSAAADMIPVAELAGCTGAETVIVGYCRTGGLS